MEWAFLLPYAVAALTVPFAIHVERRRRRARVRTWHSVAERVGLRVLSSEVPLVGEPHLVARDDRRRVRFDRRRVGKHTSYTWVTVDGGSGLTLRPERRKDFLSQDLFSIGREEREIELGDELFDAAVEVRGAPDRVRALLDAETRAVVLAMLDGRVAPPGGRPVPIRGRVELDEGNLRAVFDEQPSAPAPQELRDGLVALLALAERFRTPPNLAERLAASLASEPVWRVRLQGMRLLATSFPDHPATLPALRRALADEHPEVAMDAALLLGDEGTEKLLEIAQSGDVDDAIAAHAVDALGDLLPVEVGVPLLRQTLRQLRIATARACIHALAGVPDDEAGELLTKVLSLERGELAVEAAKALRRREGGDTEVTLLRALERGDPDLSHAAIEALGHVGSVRAVPFLRDAAERADATPQLRRAARQAVAEIQSRLPGVSPGQLSIAEGEAGRVSLADDDPRGRVSLPDRTPSAG